MHDQPGHRVRGYGIAELTVIAAGHGQQVELGGDRQLQQQTKPEDGCRDEYRGQGAAQPVGPATLPSSAAHAQHEPGDDSDDHGDGDQLERGHQSSGHVLDDRLSGVDGCPPVARSQSRQVADCLLRQGQIEAELFTNEGQFLARRAGAGPAGGSITRQQPGDEEGHESDADRDQQRLRQSPQQELSHRHRTRSLLTVALASCSSPRSVLYVSRPAASCRRRRGPVRRPDRRRSPRRSHRAHAGSSGRRARPRPHRR